MIVVSGSVREKMTLERVFSVLKKPEANLQRSYRNLLSWSEAHIDPVTTPQLFDAPHTLTDELSRTVISLSLPVWQKEKFVGVVGQDVSVGALSAKLRYFWPREPGSYMFLVDKEG